MILLYLFGCLGYSAGFLLPLLLNIGTGILSSQLMKGSTSNNITSSTPQSNNAQNSNVRTYNSISPNLTPSNPAAISASQISYPRPVGFTNPYNAYPTYVNPYNSQPFIQNSYYKQPSKWFKYPKFQRF